MCGVKEVGRIFCLTCGVSYIECSRKLEVAVLSKDVLLFTQLDGKPLFQKKFHSFQATVVAFG